MVVSKTLHLEGLVPLCEIVFLRKSLLEWNGEHSIRYSITAEMKALQSPQLFNWLYVSLLANLVLTLL